MYLHTKTVGRLLEMSGMTAMSLKICFLLSIGGLLKVFGTLENLREGARAPHVMSHTMRNVLIQCAESPLDCQILK